MKTQYASYDLVVCGGGLAGVSAAIAAARQGISTCLIQDRPVFGGNSSSEIRVTPHGAAAFHDYARETGIISEILIEERSRNHEEINENGWVNSVMDMTLYDWVECCPHLSYMMNTSVIDLKLKDGRTGRELMELEDAKTIDMGFVHRPSLHEKPVDIASVRCRVANAEVEWVIEGKTFVDCTGDGLIAEMAGCEWRMGEESQEEFGEPHAPAKASAQTMGNSIHIRCRDMGRPCPFVAPEWAVKHEDPAFFYEQGRPPKDPRGGFWWIEIGVPWHTIHDNETIRHELTRHALGVWDWMKNRDPVMKDRCENYAMDFIGQVPGKRESRRIIGEYFLTEHDIMQNRVFEDEIAFGGWFLDLHTPGGLLADSSEPASAEGYNPISDYAVKSYCGPYGIPLGILLSKDIGNLMMAGRNVSVTHAALGTVRVMATTALMGQAAGTTVAVALKNNCKLSEARKNNIHQIQQQLLKDGCFLPNVKRNDKEDRAPKANVRASSEGVFHELAPDSTLEHGGMKSWSDQRTGEASLLKSLRGMWFANGRVGVEALEVLLINHTDSEISLPVRLWEVDHIWHYQVRPSESPLRETVLQVPPGRHWLRWECALSKDECKGLNGFLRLDLEANPEIEWVASGECAVPGHVAAFAMNDTKMRRCFGSRPSIRVHPPQPCFPASSVLRGATRPHTHTNLWQSDAEQALPQWLELCWETPQRIQLIDLTFPGQLMREFHSYPPFFRDPQCPRDYQIEIRINGEWSKVLEVKDNYQRQNHHRLDQAIEAEALRIVITATNGGPTAAIYEVRVG